MNLAQRFSLQAALMITFNQQHTAQHDSESTHCNGFVDLHAACAAYLRFKFEAVVQILMQVRCVYETRNAAINDGGAVLMRRSVTGMNRHMKSLLLTALGRWAVAADRRWTL